MTVKSIVRTAYLSCLINRFTFRPKPRTKTPFQLIDHVDRDDGWQTRDPPPLKWSDLRYVFDIKEDCNGKEAIQA